MTLSGCTISGWESSGGNTFTGEAEEEKDYEVIGEVYHVYTAKGLEAWRLATTETDGSTTDCVLEKDIVMPAPTGNDGNWTKVGDGFNPYKGIFDGNGHTIRNLVIKGGESGGSQGFFGVLYGGTVKNLTLEDPDVTSSLSGVGALVGYMTGSTIEYCQVIGGSVESSYSNNEIKFTYVGGLVGNISGVGSTITACSASCEVSCPSNGILGGLVGSVSSSTFTLTSSWYPP